MKRTTFNTLPAGSAIHIINMGLEGSGKALTTGNGWSTNTAAVKHHWQLKTGALARSHIIFRGAFTEKSVK